MNVLSIGSDEHVFEAGSTVRKRQEAYARELGHVDLVVLSKLPHASAQSDVLSLVAATGRSPFARLWSAYRIARGCSKPEVVTVQDPFEIGLVGWFVALRFGVPLHIQVHTDFLVPEFVQNSLTNLIRVNIGKFVLKRAARIRVVSNTLKIALSQAHATAEVSVLPIFTDLERFRSATAAPELVARFSKFTKKLLVVSRLEPEKNVALAIEAFASAAPQDACLIIVGDGTQRSKLEGHTYEFGVADRVLFQGERSSVEFYPLADLVLVSSKYEGYGLVIVEALAAGKPVLATEVGVAREAGAIVSSEKDFAKSLRQWFQSGPWEGKLLAYPYRDFAEYCRAYCADIEACIRPK